MAGSISTLTVTATQLIAWSAPTNDPILGAAPNASSISLREVFSNPAGVNISANQIKAFETTLAGGANTTLDLSAASNNVVDNSAATLGHVFAAIAWLPSTTQNSTLGTSASSVTIGNAASNQATVWGLSSTNDITLNNGDMVSWMTPGAGAVIGSTTKSLKILNNDGSNSANVIIVLVGTDT